MTKIMWDQVGERTYETGCDRAVLYPPSGVGVPWNGLIAVNETPDVSDPSSFYIDGTKFYNAGDPGEFKATLNAFTYPDEFSELDGSPSDGNGLYFGMQDRKPFGLSYRTLVGNDILSDSLGYKIHLVYNALAAPTTRNYSTINESPSALVLSWTLSTKPISIAGVRPTSHLIIESIDTDADLLQEIEDILYGTVSSNPRLPLPDELITMFDGV